MIKIREKNKGITLIALVITIIILLILAGITIATLGGENGLIAKVKKAKEAEIKAKMREELTLALHDLQIEKRAEATLDDVTQDWINGQIKKYECTIKDDASLNGKQVIMKKDKITGKFLIDGNLNIVEEEYNESSIEFSYETRGREGDKITVAITIKDEINGIKEVQMPDGTIYPYNKKEQVGIDYSVELGVEYKVKITSESGEVVEKTIKIDDYYYKVTKNLGEGLKIDNTAIKAAWNKPYQATITTEGDYIIDTITVTMGGQAVTVDKTTGVINIEKVTDDIEITATSKTALVDFWPLKDSTENSIGTTNLNVSKGNLSFEENSAYLNNTILKTSSAYKLPNQFTILFDYKPSEDLKPYTLILGKVTNYSYNSGCNGLFINGNTNQTGLYIGQSGNPNFTGIEKVVTTGNWSKIAITYDGSTSKLYSNSKLISEEKGIYNDLSSEMYIGGSMYSGDTAGNVYWDYANGYYKNIAIYNVAFSQQQISEK